ncbi:hypothetical protein [Sphingomonas baiyangensis]|uniref:hypothetical protein n=1 Tax=Sphingomonas baiyangensis TaxID=2572576 RepID=UPI001BAEA429|nr:hypothetical protein [Sphingomonas baiyangensis]
MMQRSHSAASGHPFRRSVLRGRVRPLRVREEDGDMKLFVLSFTAFFVCFYTLIA